MWYFAWLLGLPLAAIFAVMNAMWLEMKEDEQLMSRDLFAGDPALSDDGRAQDGRA